MTERITAMGFEEVLIGAVRVGDSDDAGGEGRLGPAWGWCVGSPKEGRTPSTVRATTNRSAPPVGPPGSPPPIPCTPGAGALGAIGGVRRPRDLRPARRARPDGAQTSRSIPPTPTTSPPPAPGPSSTTDAPGTMRPAGGLTPKPVSPGRLRASPNSSAARGGSTTTTSTDSPPRTG